MHSHMRPFLIVVSSVFACAIGSSRAAAYCQTTTSEKQATSCSSSCITEGYPLAWPVSEIEYVFNKYGFPGINTPSLRNIFKEAFGSWQSVDCDGSPVGLKVAAANYTTDLTVGPKMDEPNDNVISHLPAAEWDALGNDPNAFALTAIWFDPNSGRILGADMHFNGRMDPFGVCPDAGCSLDTRLTDLPNVATHEAGHFLGLAHSQVDDSTMWCDAQAYETNKRSLSDDDQKGMCAVYPPGLAFTPEYFPEPVSKTNNSRGRCSVGSTRPGWSGALGGLALLALGLTLRRRGR